MDVFNIPMSEKMCGNVCVSVFKMLKKLLKIGYQTDPSILKKKINK